MTYLEHTSFDKQKKSPKNTLLAILKKVVIVRRRLMDILYAQQYSTNFDVYYDIVDPTVRSTKKCNIFFKK